MYFVLQSIPSARLSLRTVAKLYEAMEKYGYGNKFEIWIGAAAFWPARLGGKMHRRVDKGRGLRFPLRVGERSPGLYTARYGGKR